MGQKTNPNILRLGKIKEWKSKYIEKKTTESSNIIFKDLEIRKFISQLFAKNELQVQNCKIAYSENSLKCNSMEVPLKFDGWFDGITVGLRLPFLIQTPFKLRLKPQRITCLVYHVIQKDFFIRLKSLPFFIVLVCFFLFVKSANTPVLFQV